MTRLRKTPIDERHIGRPGIAGDRCLCGRTPADSVAPDCDECETFRCSDCALWVSWDFGGDGQQCNHCWCKKLDL